MEIERIKWKRLIDNLNTHQGHNTSLITLSLPSDSSLIIEKKKIESELSTCTSIKSRL